jgi:hypothetical protein
MAAVPSVVHSAALLHLPAWTFSWTVKHIKRYQGLLGFCNILQQTGNTQECTHECINELRCGHASNCRPDVEQQLQDTSTNAFHHTRFMAAV